MLQLPDGSSVVTPVDDPVEWSANWRYAVASAWSEYPEWYPDRPYTDIMTDTDVLAYRTYESLYRHGGLAAVPDQLMPYHRAQFTYHKPVSTEPGKIEALLLTPIGFDDVARDLFWDHHGSEVVTAYSRMFFDARDAEGKLYRASQRREFLAIPPGEDKLAKSSTIKVFWKHVAHVFGYTAATKVMNTEGTADLDDTDVMLEMIRQLVQSSMIEKLLRRQVSSRDVPEYLQAATHYEKMRHDIGKGAFDIDSEAVKTLVGVLGLLQPRRIIAAQEVDGMERETERIRNKVAADLEVKKQKLMDQSASAGYERINKLIEAKVMNEDAV